ncbi:MAG TPA: class II glutamine amidotransferase [Micromonosporaceae bacterium]
MCRLFGMTTGDTPVEASFWLLDAPDSLRAQSRRMPDGVGLGWFGIGGEPVRDRAPIAAFADREFETEARVMRSDTFVAHVRYATTGRPEVHNTHPFDMRDRLFAHNGVLRGLDVLRTWLSPADLALVEGETDSELLFAWITARVAALGDTRAGIVDAIARVAAELPVYALNFVLAEHGRIWALRYPDVHQLWVLKPGPASTRGRGEPMRVADRSGRLRMTSVEPRVPSVVVASEMMDDDPDWRLLEPGELLGTDGTRCWSAFPFGEPAHRLTKADLSEHEATAQEPGRAVPAG